MQFVITAYDGVGLLERRMEVRPRHMEGMARMAEHVLCAAVLPCREIFLLICNQP